MATSTIRNDYVLGKNLALMVNANRTGTTSVYVKGGKVKDIGVYEITFTYSVRKDDATTAGNPHFYIGFGTFTDGVTGSYSVSTLVRLGADNTAVHNYPNQRAVTVWVVKTDDTERDFMCSENSSKSTWYMYNINACARKIADI